jgi:hypothetical protein
MQKLTQLPHDQIFLGKCQDVPSKHTKGYLKKSFKDQNALTITKNKNRNNFFGSCE